MDFSHPDKISKVITSSMINCAKACIPRGREKRYKRFWTDDLETLKNQREYQRKRAEHTGKVEDVQAWRRQAPILRREITESKRKSFKNFISPLNYQKDSQKTYKYLTRIQNNTSYSSKVPIHENNDVIISDRGIANTFACTSVFHEHRRRARTQGENQRWLKESIKKMKLQSRQQLKIHLIRQLVNANSKKQ
jgi:hypothetical protein